MSHVSLRTGRQDDAEAVRSLAAECPPLEVYPLHQYVILLRTCGNLCCVAELDGNLVGFEVGIPTSRNEGVYFLWQIGVAPSQRGTGLARRLLEELEKPVRRAGYHTIALTVDPRNGPSYGLFTDSGYENVSSREPRTVEIDGRLAAADHYGPGRHFTLFEKRLGEMGDEC